MEQKIRHRGGKGKMWDELNPNQKRHRIFVVTNISGLRFWRICGRDRQIYYQHEVECTVDTVDTIRDNLFKEYSEALEKLNLPDAKRKLKFMKKILYGKGEK